jgi:hypothetical protein
VVYIKIYGTIIEMNIVENTSAVDLYNKVTRWMNIDSSSLSIEICRIGKDVEGMGHILTAEDFIWNGIYNFNWFTVKITGRKQEIIDQRIIPEENIEMMIDLNIIIFKTNMNRFFKLSTVKKIIENRFMKEYKMRLIFKDLSSTMYCNDMKLEMFCGETLRGYVMENKFIFKKINYKNGAVDMAIENQSTIGDLKKKLCKCYCLGLDIIITYAKKGCLIVI